MNAKRIWKSAVLCSLGGLFVAASPRAHAQSGHVVPTVEVILTRMAQARAENRTQLRPYSVTRNYRLFDTEKLATRAEVIADLTFVPPDRKHYAIRQANGMGLGEKIVRQML